MTYLAWANSPDWPISVAALICGICLLVWPQVLSYWVGFYLISIGTIVFWLWPLKWTGLALMTMGVLCFVVPRWLPYLFAIHLLFLAILVWITSGWGLIVALFGVGGVALLLFPEAPAYILAIYLIGSALFHLWTVERKHPTRPTTELQLTSHQALTISPPLG